MKILYLIRGLSGSGKTTLANSIVSDLQGRVAISVDEFFENENGEYSFDAERLKEAHEWCVSETDLIMQDNYEIVVVHNTFTRKWEADAYFKLAEKHGYQTQVVSLYDAGLNDKGLSERCSHGVSEKVIQNQRKRWELDIYPHRNNRPRHDQIPQVAPFPYYPAPYPAPSYQGGYGNPYANGSQGNPYGNPYENPQGGYNNNNNNNNNQGARRPNHQGPTKKWTSS